MELFLPAAVSCFVGLLLIVPALDRAIRSHNGIVIILAVLMSLLVFGMAVYTIGTVLQATIDFYRLRRLEKALQKLETATEKLNK